MLEYCHKVVAFAAVAGTRGIGRNETNNVAAFCGVYEPQSHVSRFIDLPTV